MHAHEYKVVTLGEGRVGKTSLSLRFVRDFFREDEISTIQANFLEKTINVSDTPVKINLWDTAG
jgi:small GTP-binding protein